jgi:hypothetical protein
MFARMLDMQEDVTDNKAAKGLTVSGTFVSPDTRRSDVALEEL